MEIFMVFKIYKVQVKLNSGERSIVAPGYFEQRKIKLLSSL